MPVGASSLRVQHLIVRQLSRTLLLLACGHQRRVFGMSGRYLEDESSVAFEGRDIPSTYWRLLQGSKFSLNEAERASVRSLVDRASSNVCSYGFGLLRTS
jgi:hypothetical protein